MGSVFFKGKWPNTCFLLPWYEVRQPGRRGTKPSAAAHLPVPAPSQCLAVALSVGSLLRLDHGQCTTGHFLSGPSQRCYTQPVLRTRSARLQGSLSWVARVPRQLSHHILCEYHTTASSICGRTGHSCSLLAVTLHLCLLFAWNQLILFRVPTISPVPQRVSAGSKRPFCAREFSSCALSASWRPEYELWEPSYPSLPSE